MSLLDGGDRLGGLGQRVEGALDALQPPLGFLQPAGRGLMLHVDGLEPGGGLPVGAERVVVLGPDPADPLRHLRNLPAQGLRLAPDGRHGAFQAQHPLDILPEL